MAFQKFRAFTRNPQAQVVFLAKPLAERVRMARRRPPCQRSRPQPGAAARRLARSGCRGCGGLAAGGGSDDDGAWPYPSPGPAMLAPGFERAGAERLGPGRRAPACRGAAPAPRRPRAPVPGRCHTRLMGGWWQRLRQRSEQRALERRAIPDELWQLTLVRYPFLARRDAADLTELRRLSSLFLDSKEFSGAQRLASQRRHGGGHRCAGLPAGAAPGPAALRRLRRHRRAPGRGAGAARGRRRRRRRARVRRRAGRRGHGRRPGDAVVARCQRAPATVRPGATTW